MTTGRGLSVGGLLAAHRRRLAVAAACAAATRLAGMGLLAMSTYLISFAALRPNVLQLTAAIVGVRALALVRATGRYAERLATHDVAFRVLADLRVQVYCWLVPHAPLDLRHREGDLLSRAVEDVDALQQLVVTAVLAPLVAVVTATVAVVTTALLLPRAAAVLAAGLLVAGVAVPAVSWRRGRAAAAAPARARGTLTAEVVDLVAAAPDLAVNGGVDAALARVAEADRAVARAERGVAARGGLGTALLLAVTGITTLGVARVGIDAVTAGRLAGVTLGAVVVLAFAAFEVIGPLGAAAQDAPVVLAAADRLNALADREPVVRDGPRAAIEAPRPARAGEHGSAGHGSVDGGGPALRPARHGRGRTSQRAAPPPESITLRGANVHYPGSGVAALEGLDLDLEPGRRVAVVGASGAGKTTLLAALQRFVPLAAGFYGLDGVAVDALPAATVRARLAVVEQHPTMFATTIAANLRLASPDATDLEVAEALRRAQLHTWVRQLPAGLDTVIGDGGRSISAGEQQRLALARALLSDRPYLLLDEPTASLDPLVGAAFLSDMLGATRDRGLLLATHDLRALRHMDEVVVVAQGRVVERGGLERLLAARGTLAAMWALDGHGRQSAA